MSKYRTVSQLAALAHLSVRALHHYDAIGLLKPSHRSVSGYRLYDANDVLKLREIVLYRELGFTLEQIANVLTMNTDARAQALLEQRSVIEQKRAHAEALLTVLDATVNQFRNITMSKQNIFQGVDQFKHGEYAKEAEAQWGHTDAYKESNKRTKNYQDKDWQAINAEAHAITQAFLQLMQNGIAAKSPEASALAEQHRAHICRWFYDCPPAMHKNVTAMYVSDARFQAHYDQHGPGLAAYISAACAYHADR